MPIGQPADGIEAGGCSSHPKDVAEARKLEFPQADAASHTLREADDVSTPSTAQPQLFQDPPVVRVDSSPKPARVSGEVLGLADTGHGSPFAALHSSFRDSVEQVREFTNSTVQHSQSLVENTVQHSQKIVEDTVHHSQKIVEDTVQHSQKIVEDTVQHSQSLVDKVAPPPSSSPNPHCRPSLE